MIDNLSFEHNNWMWQIISAAILLCLVFVWKEWRKKDSPRFVLRVCSAILAISALTYIALKPLKYITKKSFQAIVITNGFHKHQLDSLKKENKKIVIYNYTINAPPFNGDNIPETVVVIGNGVKPFDLWQLENIPTTYLGGNAPKGITQLQYNTKNTIGNRVEINGFYSNPTNGHKLILEGPGGTVLDSINLTNNTQIFQLTAELTTIGKFLFTLVEKDSLNEIITKDPLPIIVEKQNQLKILIINSNPTFETKYLKNYLAENGHQVLARSQLTKAKYKFEYFNMNKKPLIAFSQKNLQAFDLAIIDATSLRTFSKQTINTIKTSIRENGLGLFIQPDNSFYSQKRKISNFIFNPEKLTEAKLETWPKSKITKYPFYFKSDFALQPVHESNNKIWIGYHRLEAGRIGTTVFQNTYELLLRGQTKAYNYLWTETIKNISKRKSSVHEWYSDAQISFINEPYNFNLRTGIDKPIISTIRGYNIPMQRDIDIKSLWNGLTYPRHKGWQTLSVAKDTSNVFHYYVTDTTSWKSLTTQKTINENKRYFNKNLVSENKQALTKKLINPIWFYLVFILSIGYLWFESKL